MTDPKEGDNMTYDSDGCGINQWCDLQDGHREPCQHIHDRRFDGDDPYLICRRCGERQDALTGRVITPGRVTNR